MNNRGQVVMLYTLMLAVVVIILAMAFAPTLQVFTDDARAPTTTDSVGLDCANTSISDFDKANCTLIDMTLPFIIISLIVLAGVIIGAKVVFA